MNINFYLIKKYHQPHRITNMVNINVKDIMKSVKTDMLALLNDNVQEFISSFKAKNSKLIENIINDWNSEENQEKMKKSVNDLLNKKVKKEKNKAEKKEKAGGDKPKKNKSVYICFCVSKREEMRKKYSDMDNKSITRMLAEEWNKIKEDEEKLQPFKDMADEDKDRYNKEMSENNLEHKSKGKKNADGPVKNLSAYIHYCKYMRPLLVADGSLSNKEIVSEMGRRWKLLKDENPEEFSRFERMALEDKERYAKDKENINKTTENEVVVEKKKVEKKKTEKKTEKKKEELVDETESPAIIFDTQETQPDSQLDKFVELESPAIINTQETQLDSHQVEPEAKKKKSVNAYINYCKKERDNVKSANPDAVFKDITVILSRQWKSLTKEEQEVYKNI